MDDKIKREALQTRDRDTATITCRHCGKSKKIDLAPFQTVRKTLKVKCPCSAAFEVVFDNRRDPRLPVKLSARLIDAHSHHCIANVTITSLSLSDLRFTPSLTEQLQPGDHYTIAFTLDDADKTAVEKAIIIRHVQADATGAEFVEQGYHQDLDFYLMPLLALTGRG